MDFTHLSAQLSSSPLTALPILFIAGVLTSLTPCIYPMIPITAAIVGGSSVGDAPRPRARTVMLTFAYVIGLATAYASLGLFAGLSGTIFGSVSTNPWLYFAMANLLVLAALAMLDVIPVRLPTALLTRAATAGEGGKVSGALIMGAVSGLVAAPCSAPVMAAVLTWVTATKSGVLGFIYLFVFSLGMCTLLVVVGLFSGSARAPAEGGRMDGLGEATICADHVGRCGVLPCADGSAAYLRLPGARYPVPDRDPHQHSCRKQSCRPCRTSFAQRFSVASMIAAGICFRRARVRAGSRHRSWIDRARCRCAVARREIRQSGTVHRQDADADRVLGDVVPELS